jgi:hypothetical protein
MPTEWNLCILNSTSPQIRKGASFAFILVYVLETKMNTKPESCFTFSELKLFILKHTHEYNIT